MRYLDKAAAQVLGFDDPDHPDRRHFPQRFRLELQGVGSGRPPSWDGGALAKIGFVVETRNLIDDGMRIEDAWHEVACRNGVGYDTVRIAWWEFRYLIT
jgi:hypothetical protein